LRAVSENVETDSKAVVATQNVYKKIDIYSIILQTQIQTCTCTVGKLLQSQEVACEKYISLHIKLQSQIAITGGSQDHNSFVS
jgi:hypothetical protein